MKLNFVLRTPWQSIFKILEKAPKIKTCAKFIMEVMLRRSLVLGIKETQINKTFMAPRITSMLILVSFRAISLRLYSSFSSFNFINVSIIIRLILVARLLLIDK